MVNHYLDVDGKIFVLPRKKSIRIELYKYLMEKFEDGRIYSEKEVNDIIFENHSFNDTCLLRRELVEYGFLNRNDNGTCYNKVNVWWRENGEKSIKEDNKDRSIRLFWQICARRRYVLLKAGNNGYNIDGNMVHYLNENNYICRQGPYQPDFLIQ